GLGGGVLSAADLRDVARGDAAEGSATTLLFVNPCVADDSGRGSRLVEDLHGLGVGGAGKASLVRAGVIPFLEDDCVGYRFLRDRSETEDQGETPVAEADFPVLAVRATNNLAGQLAQALCAFCARPYAYATPAGKVI